MKVHVKIRQAGTDKQSEAVSETATLSQRSFFVVPEFQIPRKSDTNSKTAVADDGKPEAEWLWGEKGQESMHPFWAVRKLTEKQLQKQQMKIPEGQLKPRLNCELQMKTLSCVCIATAKDTCLNRTRIIEAPFLVNSTALEKGEELILEIAEVKAKKDNTKRTWKDAMKEEDKEAKKQRGKRETKDAESNFD